MSNKSSSRLVYSTETGRCCPDCGQPVAHCVCRTRAATVPAGDGNVRVARQTKGRGGKTVTQVKGVALDADALADLGKQLRTACGAGGTVKDGVIEVQGDHCTVVLAALAKLGFKARQG